MQPLIILVGPTAVGKSALAVELASILNGEIISGDSVQVYQKLDIGSAKPTVAEQKNIPHHLIDFLDPKDSFTVARFQTLAQDTISSIKAKNRTPIIVGGTGLYIRSILDGYDFPEEGSSVIQEKWLVYAKRYGNRELHKQLAMVDSVSAEKLHSNDTARVIRALEVYEITGKALSSQRNYEEKEYPALDESIFYLGLTGSRELIYQRINQRCEEMISLGLLEETWGLLQGGYSPKLKSLQSIGYRHAIAYLYGQVTKDEMLRLFKRDTRRFAKRQLTWFRRDPRIKWHDITNRCFSEILSDIYNTVTSGTCRDF